MLLSINKDKVRELVAANPPRYSITSSNLPTISIPAEPDSVSVWGTASCVPAEFDKAKARLREMRRKFAETGGQFLRADELRHAIDEIRGRLPR